MEEPQNGIPYVRHYRPRKWVCFSDEHNFPPGAGSGSVLVTILLTYIGLLWIHTNTQLLLFQYCEGVGDVCVYILTYNF